MVKYSFEFKLKIVHEYLSGSRGYSFISKKYGIPSATMPRDWVINYQAFGEEGLQRIKKKKDYSVQFKQDAIELYLSKRISYRNLATELGMTNPNLIVSWMTTFRAEGLQGLAGAKGWPSEMKNNKKKNGAKKAFQSPIESNHSKRIQELETQILSLQIQNAFLKELRSLQTQENQEPTNKLPESSTDSAENSN